MPVAAAPQHRAPPRGLVSEEGAALAGLLAILLITGAWWALALWPVPHAPAWLERTRYVCFGIGPSGLPDGGGWIGLTAGPLGMLAILLVGWADGVRGLLARARRSRRVAATLLLFPLGVALLAGAATLRVRQARVLARLPEVAGTLSPGDHPRLDQPAPPLALTAQDGATRSLASLRGRTVLVTFAYAHCETVCPVVVRHVLEAQRRLRAAGAAPAVLVVTLDPWRDTPSRLPAMAREWGLPDRDAWVLGGTVAAVEAALAAWRVPYRRDERTGEVVHPALVHIVDPDGRIAFSTTGGAETIAALVRRLPAADPRRGR
ncbi:MAG: SCO family protein [Gemmatimonadetes bacterium]|nr:SCO family protein [Gemmatimonadota bacterium]